MMAVTVVLSEVQRDVLTKVCDTFVPALEVADDPTGFYARSASDLGIVDAIEQTLAESAPEAQLDGLRALLDAPGAAGIAAAPLAVREQIPHAVMDSGPEALAGLAALRGLTHLLFYALPDATGRNPSWEAIGYPGPVSAAPTPEQAPKRIGLTRPTGELLELTADVVIVGS